MNLVDANRFLKLTEEEMEELLAIQAEIDADEKLTGYLNSAYNDIYIDEKDHKELEKIYNACVPNDAYHGLFYILVGIKNLEKAVKIFEEHNVSMDILTHTLQDTALWIRNYKRHNGYLGLASRSWISVGFKGKLFRLGRMQFEMTTIKQETGLPYLSKGDPALEGHVPQGEPLDHEACMESYRRAFPFFEEHFGYHAKAVHLKTWMLDPEMKKILPPDSNIMKWANDATLLPVEEKMSDLSRFIFGQPTIDLKTAPRDTTLRRKILEHIEAGGEFCNRAGIIMRETIMGE